MGESKRRTHDRRRFALQNPLGVFPAHWENNSNTNSSGRYMGKRRWNSPCNAWRLSGGAAAAAAVAVGDAGPAHIWSQLGLAGS